MRTLFVALCLSGAGPAAAAVDPIALFNAIELDDVRAVERAIARGDITPDSRIVVPGYGDPGAPLIAVAGRAGSLNVVRFLIARRADLNARTPAGETAIMLASFFTDGKSEAIVRELADAGASLENEPGSYTPLAYAAYAGNARLVDFLLAKGARPDGALVDGQAVVPTPLMMAVMNGHRDAARLLLRAEADPRVQRPGGVDARALAVRGNQGHILPLIDCALSVPANRPFSESCGDL